jgi:hypothetical protein
MQNPTHPARSVPEYAQPGNGPVCRNTTVCEVAAPTLKRGLVMPKFKRYGFARAAMVAGKMGHTVRLAARRIPCYEHLAHPPCVVTRRVVFESLCGAETMTKVIPLVRPHAPITSTPDTSTTHPEAIRLHGLASNALSMAASLLNRTDTTPAQLKQATARAVRAATLLKRLSAMHGEVAA